MGWLSDLFGGPAPATVPQATPAAPSREDTPEELERSRQRLVREINSASGDLPPAGTVLARRITDLVGETVALGRDRGLNVHARISLDAILTDYMPTTLRSYAAAARAGHDGEDQLREQLTALHEAARDLLESVRRDDINALEAQGAFLRAKYTGSDLDL